MHRDKDAFTQLVKDHQPKLRMFLLRLSNNYDLADDLAQETLITAYKKLSSFKGSGSFSGWLFRIAYNQFLQFHRSEKRREEILIQYGEVLAVDSDRYESINDIQADLERALSRLNPGEAAAITLCHSFGFAHPEVARIMDVPLGTIKSQIRRGKEKLTTFLNEEPGATGDNLKQNESTAGTMNTDKSGQEANSISRLTGRARRGGQGAADCKMPRTAAIMTREGIVL